MKTTPRGIQYPEAGDAWRPLNQHMQRLAESTDTAFGKQAMIKLVPTSAPGSLITPEGNVTWNKLDSVIVNGVLDWTKYLNYHIEFMFRQVTADTSFSMGMRTGGVLDLSENYAWNRRTSKMADIDADSSFDDDGFPVNHSPGDASLTSTEGEIDIRRYSRTSEITGRVRSTNNNDYILTSTDIDWAFRVTDKDTNFDGFSINPTHGGTTFNGILRIYGYN